ncbi:MULTISPECIES: magnesium transporter [unclassified Ectothiorhodospira]|uniref:magnesium transporter n=1 Tax=unclassified Ectothiorhodospira TaxID=2684909 RepID=UPI001EE8C344|nr:MULTISPECIES: magnesium transporter [unclassified Ectothiorhodospira]MCG5516501.1 magnesium transporter [Ectothiorhodospira sp. 9100]MCG5519543.1 magnesium transporter [Ectothiorhodospira sp. 9905]
MIDETVAQANTKPPETTQAELLAQVVEHLDAGRRDDIVEHLEAAHAAEVADLLESLPPDQRSGLWDVIPAEQEGEILSHLRDEARASIIEEMDDVELVAAARSMAPEDLAEVIEELPDERHTALLQTLDGDHRQRLQAVLTFGQNTAGRLMSTDVLSVRPDVSVAVVLRWLRRHQVLPPHTDTLMVIDEQGHYLATLGVDRLLTSDPQAIVGQLMRQDTVVVRADMSEHEVAALFERRDLISLPVLDQEDHLLGRITIDDVVDIIREESDKVLLNRAGLDEDEDLFAPVMPSARRRGLWLGINLMTVFLAAAVIGRFEAVLDQIVALAVLLPIVASMGGIAGSQTLTLMIRGLALDQIAKANIRWLIGKEIAVGALNGIAWALVVALVAYLWFGSAGISVTIASAMILNLLIAALAGVLIPLGLKRVGIDPALSGAVILTTVTDIVGFLSFLGLATVILL